MPSAAISSEMLLAGSLFGLNSVLQQFFHDGKIDLARPGIADTALTDIQTCQQAPIRLDNALLQDVEGDMVFLTGERHLHDIVLPITRHSIVHALLIPGKHFQAEIAKGRKALTSVLWDLL